MDLRAGAETAILAADNHRGGALATWQHERNDVGLRGVTQAVHQLGADRIEAATRIELGFELTEPPAARIRWP